MLLFSGRTSVQQAGMQQMLWGFPSNFGVGAQPEDERVTRSADSFALTVAMQHVRNDLFLEVGGFDERYIWRYEDADLCLKIRADGIGVVYEPRAVGVHFESATLNPIQRRDAAGNYRIYRQTSNPVRAPVNKIISGI